MESSSQHLIGGDSSMSQAVQTWQPIVAGNRAESAKQVALDVLAKYRERPFILAVARQLNEQTGLPALRNWQASSLPFGDAGVAMALGYAHRIQPTEEWDQAAHHYLNFAIQNVSRVTHPSLIGGLSGLNFAVDYLSLGRQRYQKARKALDELLSSLLASTVVSLPDDETGVSFSQYDQISGVSGIGRYLLNAEKESTLSPYREKILAWLIKRTDKDVSRGFFTPPQKAPQKELELVPRLARGYINCGLAHGVPGPLALLSLATSQGLKEPHLHNAVRKLADWLVAQHYDDGYGVNWPDYYIEDNNLKGKSRTAWCYGLPGIVRTLYLAGRALNDRYLQDFAVESLISVEERPLEVRAIDSPTFCHGIAGLLQIVLRFANDTGDFAFTRFAASLVDQLLILHETEAPLGFRDIETRGSIVDSPGLLTGALGPALVLLAASTDCPPNWDQVFLLS